MIGDGFPEIAVPPDVETPAVCADLDLMHANIHRMAARLRDRGVAFRPHAKTHKSTKVAAAQLDAGASGITTATVSEAEVFIEAGVSDVFVAYPVWADEPRARRIGRLAERATLAVGVDSVEGARQLAGALPHPDRVRVLVEVDSGERRTGARTAEAAARVASAAADGGLDVIGVFTHGGHSYASAAAADPAARDEVDALTQAADALRSAGHDVRVVSAGSTPTALRSALGAITEERPGTFVFGDRQQVALGAHRADSVALAVVATVVSATVPGQVVLDAGAKVLTKDRPATVEGYGALPGYPQAAVARLYDHHALVDLRGGPGPRVGDRVAVVPNHACPVVNTVDQLHMITNGRLVDRWPVSARGRNW